MMKIDITNFMPSAEYVYEYSQTHNTDLTTAAFDRKESEFSCRESIQQTQQQLAMLNMSTARQQKAIATLIDLLLGGR
jgi:hypothetical protein